MGDLTCAVGDTILLLMNAHYEAIPFTLPALREGQPWERLFDTADPQGESRQSTCGQQYELQGRSMTVLRTRAQQDEALQTVATAAAPER
jgi:isoamylase